MARGLSRLELKRLQQAIQWGMRYWYCRLILQWGAMASLAWANYRTLDSVRRSQRCCQRPYQKARYARLRAKGLTSYQARAVLKGTSVVKLREQTFQRERQRYARYGGNTRSVGSEAWKRWMLRDV